MAASTETVPLRRPAWYEGRYASWLVTTDHKRIGMLYISTSLLFFIGGGILALLMRSQLATANEDFIVRDSYSELFTIHGTAMVFLVVVPILAGFGNFLVPLMIGARDVAFPRLNAMSYWSSSAGSRCSSASSPAAARRSAAGRVTRRSRRPSTRPGTASTCGSCRCTC